MPALRDRPSDIPELAGHFLNKIAEAGDTARKQLSRDALEKFMKYSWPGNVRQLEHALESAVALSGAAIRSVSRRFRSSRRVTTPELERCPRWTCRNAASISKS